MSEGYKMNVRDIVFYPIVALAMRLMSPHYRALIKGSIQYGMNAAARDHRDGRPSPDDWRTYVD